MVLADWESKIRYELSPDALKERDIAQTKQQLTEQVTVIRRQLLKKIMRLVRPKLVAAFLGQSRIVISQLMHVTEEYRTAAEGAKYAEIYDYVQSVLTDLSQFIEQFIPDNLQRSSDKIMQVFLAFKGAEIYLLHKSFIDAGGAPGEIYKTLLEKTAPFICNKTQKGFSAESLCKYSDKVTPEVKENVKRFLMKMIRNVESYD